MQEIGATKIGAGQQRPAKLWHGTLIGVGVSDWGPRQSELRGQGTLFWIGSLDAAAAMQNTVPARPMNHTSSFPPSYYTARCTNSGCPTGGRLRVHYVVREPYSG